MSAYANQPYSRLPHGWFGTPEAISMGKDGGYLFLVIQDYSSTHLTDGTVTAEQMARLLHDAYASQDVVDHLVQRGHLAFDGERYTDPAWGLRQRTAAEVREIKEKRSKAGKAGMQSRWGTKGAGVTPVIASETQAPLSTVYSDDDPIGITPAKGRRKAS